MASYGARAMPRPLTKWLSILKSGSCWAGLGPSCTQAKFDGQVVAQMLVTKRVGQCFEFMTAQSQTNTIIQGSLEVKLLTIWTDEKHRWEESEKEERKKEDQRRERVRRKKMPVRQKVGKLQITVFFQWVRRVEK